MNFANTEVAVQSWYVAAKSEQVPPGGVYRFDLRGRPIAVYREQSGVLRAVDGRCPHLGGDLGQARVEGSHLRCAFHGWRVGPDGQCAPAPGRTAAARSVRVYPVVERWGVIWVFNGPRPLFELPAVDACGPRTWVVRLPVQTLDCHPHLVIGNGLDGAHYDALHDIELTQPPRLGAPEPFATSIELSGRPRSRRLRWLTGTRRADMVASFRAIGGSIAVATVWSPIRLQVLFSGRPDPQGRCRTQTLVFFGSRNPLYVSRALGLFYLLLSRDRRMLDQLDFAPDFTEDDVGLRRLAEVIDAMEVW
jgi:aminopyrrolnitrin oxygenase